MRRNRIKGVVAFSQRRKNVGDTQPKSDGSIIIISDSENKETKKLKGVDEDIRDPVIESSEKSPNQRNKTSSHDSTPNCNIQTTEIPCSNEPLLFHRNILKIPESINVLSKWSEETLKDEEKPQEKIENESCGEEEACENHNKDNDVKNLSQTNTNQNVSQSTSAAENGFRLDATILNNVTEPEETNEKEKQSGKTIQLMSSVVHSDTEYPPPPSPTKVNRLRIKAIPRFGYRKASFSASESEDESRKHNRNRNDSTPSNPTSRSAVSEHILKTREERRAGKVVRKQCKNCYLQKKRKDTIYVCSLCTGNPGYCMDCAKITHE